MTPINQEHLKRFGELYKHHFGANLSKKETEEKAQKLVGFVKILLLPNNRETLGKK